jgi:hypothetical protein
MTLRAWWQRAAPAVCITSQLSHSYQQDPLADARLCGISGTTEQQAVNRGRLRKQRAPLSVASKTDNIQLLTGSYFQPLPALRRPTQPKFLIPNTCRAQKRPRLKVIGQIGQNGETTLFRSGSRTPKDVGRKSPTFQLELSSVAARLGGRTIGLTHRGLVLASRTSTSRQD